MTDQFRRRTRTSLLCVHCSATRPSLDIGVDEIRDWHQKRGWADIGYHAVIRRSGAVVPGRPAWAVGAHEPSINAVSYAVCLVGGLDAAGNPAPDYTSAQWQALRAHLRQMQGAYGLDGGVVGHNQFAAKACPSFQVLAWWRDGTVIPVR